MDTLKRGDKLYLNEQHTKESCINDYIAARDAIVEVYEYTDSSGYGSKARIFLCVNTKHDTTSIVRQTWSQLTREWQEEAMEFDTDSFIFLEALIESNRQAGGAVYSLLRTY